MSVQIPTTIEELRARGSEIMLEAGELQAAVKRQDAVAAAADRLAERTHVDTMAGAVAQAAARVEAAQARYHGLVLGRRYEQLARESAYVERELHRLEALARSETH